MTHKVSIESSSRGTFLKIDDKYYGHVNAIPNYIKENLDESQVKTIHEFFGVETDPRGDVEKVFGKK